MVSFHKLSTTGNFVNFPCLLATPQHLSPVETTKPIYQVIFNRLYLRLFSTNFLHFQSLPRFIKNQFGVTSSF